MTGPMELVSEGVLLQDMERLRPALAGQAEGLGQVDIEAADAKFSAFDAADTLVLSICLNPLPHLVKGETFAFEPFSGVNKYRLIASGDDVVFFKNDEVAAMFPRRELLPALLACGERYLAFLEKLLPAAPAVPLRVRIFRLAVDEARAALAAAA